MMPFRFLICAPFTLIALACFATYFGLKSRVGMVAKVALVLTAGIATAITNPLYNLTFATFIFWEWPPLRNEHGKLSPFFTTRIKARMDAGRDDPMTRWFVWAVNTYDPGHFQTPGPDMRG